MMVLPDFESFIPRQPWDIQKSAQFSPRPSLLSPKGRCCSHRRCLVSSANSKKLYTVPLAGCLIQLRAFLKVLVYSKTVGSLFGRHLVGPGYRVDGCFVGEFYPELGDVLASWMMKVF